MKKEMKKEIDAEVKEKIENIRELIKETKDGFDGFVSEFLDESKKAMLIGLKHAKSADEYELGDPVVCAKRIEYFDDLHRGLFDCSDSYYYANYYQNSGYVTDSVYYSDGCFEIENYDQDVVATCNTVDEVIDYLKQQLHLFLKNSVSDAEDRIDKYIEFGC